MFDAMRHVQVEPDEFEDNVLTPKLVEDVLRDNVQR